MTGINWSDLGLGTAADLMDTTEFIAKKTAVDGSKTWLRFPKSLLAQALAGNSGGGITDAPNDGNPYLREFDKWVSPDAAGIVALQGPIKSVTVGEGGDYSTWTDMYAALRGTSGTVLQITALSRTTFLPLDSIPFVLLCFPLYTAVLVDFGGFGIDTAGLPLYLLGAQLGMALQGTLHEPTIYIVAIDIINNPNAQSTCKLECAGGYIHNLRFDSPGQEFHLGDPSNPVSWWEIDQQSRVENNLFVHGWLLVLDNLRINGNLTVDQFITAQQVNLNVLGLTTISGISGSGYGIYIQGGRVELNDISLSGPNMNAVAVLQKGQFYFGSFSGVVNLFSYPGPQPIGTTNWWVC